MAEIAIVWDVMLFDVKFTDVQTIFMDQQACKTTVLIYNQAQVRMQLTNSDSPRARTSPI
jgi:hypothetical protein